MVGVDHLDVGQAGVITRITARGALRQRLLDVGMLPGGAILVERTGPGGQPIWVRTLNGRIALRRGEAQHIRVDGTAEERS